MATRRLRTKERRGPQLDPQLEDYINGNDAALKDEQLLERLARLWIFMTCTDPLPELTKHERSRLDLLEQRYHEIEDRKTLEDFRQRAASHHVLRRFEILLDNGQDPVNAFSQALGPGENSIVRNVPRDVVEG